MAVNFVDRVSCTSRPVTAGRAWLRSNARSSSRSGPDGGNGAAGLGSWAVDPQATTLLDYHHTPHRRATNGKRRWRRRAPRRRRWRPRPALAEGTVVKDGSGAVLADLVGHDRPTSSRPAGVAGRQQVARVARGWPPGFALLGEPGESLDIVLELKSLADVALIGFPSAGKSSLVSVLSAAKPKIADYPFTTLVPNLGVVTAGSERYTIADVPGLIPGASEGKGLGLEFLRHVERARCSSTSSTARPRVNRDPMSELDVSEAELAATSRTTARRRRCRAHRIVCSTRPCADARDLAEMVKPISEERGARGPHRQRPRHIGLKELTFSLAKHVARRVPRSRPRSRPSARRRSPQAVDDTASRSSARTLRRRDLRVVGDGRRAGSGDRLSTRGRRLPRRPASTASGRGRLFRPVPLRVHRVSGRGQLGRLRTGADDGRRSRAATGRAATTIAWAETTQTPVKAQRVPRVEDAQTAARDQLAAESKAGHWATVRGDDTDE